MPKKKYIISLTAEERKQLEQLTKTGKAPAYKINHARILLKADTNQDEGGWTDKHISQALDVSISTIERSAPTLGRAEFGASLGSQISAAAQSLSSGWRTRSPISGPRL